MANNIKCPKCAGSMAEGFLLDRGDYDYKRQQIWVEGVPVASFWSGLKTSDKRGYNVRAFRCNNCNFLEFYTAEEADLSGFFN